MTPVYLGMWTWSRQPTEVQTDYQRVEKKGYLIDIEIGVAVWARWSGLGI